MAAPFFSTPFQPYVYQSQQGAVTAFQILGGDSQAVQMMLKPEEKIIAKPGTICFMSGNIKMEHNYVPENEGGILQWLLGRSVKNTVLFNSGPDDGYVGIAAPSPSRILPMDLSNLGGEILCQMDLFLCSTSDVTVTNTIDQRLRNNAEVGAEMVLKQKLRGQGMVFILGGGTVMQKILAPGEIIIVDISSIVAMTATTNFQLKNPHLMRRAVFRAEMQQMATLTGPGVVFVQSLPFPRLSQRIARSVAAPTLRDNPRFFFQIMMFFFLAYVMIVSSIILTDV